jgi:hypothetical protein
MNHKAPPTARRARLARHLALDHNPLRRRADRLETCITAGLLAAFLAGAPPVAVAAGSWAHARRPPPAARPAVLASGSCGPAASRAAPGGVQALVLADSMGSGPVDPAGRARPPWRGPGATRPPARHPAAGVGRPLRAGGWPPAHQRRDHRPGNSRPDARGGRTGGCAARRGPGGPVAAGPPSARRLGSRLDLDRATMDPPPRVISCGFLFRGFEAFLDSERGDEQHQGGHARIETCVPAWQGGSVADHHRDRRAPGGEHADWRLPAPVARAGTRAGSRWSPRSSCSWCRLPGSAPGCCGGPALVAAALATRTGG